MENAEVGFTDDALRRDRRAGEEKDTGARALRSIIEEVMLDIMFELPDRTDKGKYLVTPEVVRGERSLFDRPTVIATTPAEKPERERKKESA